MANGDENRQSSWTSWFAPGDSRHASNQENDAKRPDPVASLSHAEGTPQPESNPLISFKHFVDDAFSAVTNFNKNLKDMQHAMRKSEAVLGEKYDKRYKRWTGSENTEELVFLDEESRYVTLSKETLAMRKPPSDEARAKAKMLLLESERRNRHVDPERIAALFDEEPYVEAFTRWLSIDWFSHDPYSPVQLEADSALAKYDTKWRHAFENLLEAALDKPMTSRERFGYRHSRQIEPVSTWRGPGLDWMLSLQCRGILPPPLPTMYLNSRITSDFLAKEGLSSMMARWCQPCPPVWTNDSALVTRALRDEYQYLCRTIDTPIPEGNMSVRGESEASSTRDQFASSQAYKAKDESCPRAQMLRQRTPEQQALQEPPSTGGCPDELGRAVSEAIGSSHEPDTELDVYEQMYNDWLQDSSESTIESARQDYEQQLRLLEQQSLEQQGHRFEGRCPDQLGRAVGDSARQEAARAFADEENGLNSLGEQARKRSEDWQRGRDELEATSDARCPDELGRAVGDFVRQGAAYFEEEDDAQADIEKAGLPLEQSMQEYSEAHERLIRDLRRHGEALWRIDRPRLLEELSEIREQLERKQESRMLEQATIATAPAHAATQTDSNQPQVLSTLTTTQTTRLPDGSVKTTVMLKRRFADGREETQESTQTSYGEPATSSASEHEDSKKGWFWS